MENLKCGVSLAKDPAVQTLVDKVANKLVRIICTDGR